MKRSRFKEEQIIAILREQEAGAAPADVCRKHGISSGTFYKWKAKFGVTDIGVIPHGNRKAGRAGGRHQERQHHEGNHHVAKPSKVGHPIRLSGLCMYYFPRFALARRRRSLARVYSR
jgi:hypothetical protein